MNKRTLQVPDFSNIQAKQSVNKQQNIAKNPVTKQMATDKITQMVNQSGIPPSMLAQIGQLAEQAIHDPKKYPQFVNFMVQHKLETAEELKKPDYQMLGMMVVVGKVAQTMPDKEAVGSPPGTASQIQGL